MAIFKGSILECLRAAHKKINYSHVLRTRLNVPPQSEQEINKFITDEKLNEVERA